MYSAVFALTVIIAIALTNLFLGFASALLMGRGPKRWSDVDRAIVLQPFAIDLILPQRRPKVQRIKSKPATKPVAIPVAPPSSIIMPVTSVTTTPTCDSAPGAVSGSGLLPHPPSESTNVDVKKFVLPSVAATPSDSGQPPEKVLLCQLDAWRQFDQREENPSMSGLTFDIRDADLDEPSVSRLTTEIQTRIVRQLRKDRRVLLIASNQFAWFSSDVTPDDSLMPVERIRQILNKTRFHYQGNALHLTFTAGVVRASEADDAAELIERLQRTMACAREQGASPTYLDKGQGPDPVTPFSLDIEETECDLDG